MTISSKSTRLTPLQPLRADNDVITLCFQLAEGYTATEELTIRTPSGTETQITGSLTLETGAVIALDQPSSMGDPCIDPAVPGPLPAPVRDVELVSSAPVRINGATWHSTAK